MNMKTINGLSGPTQAKELLLGEWADICILKDGEDYYLAHSAGLYFPGPPICHSRDLKSWKLICRAVADHGGKAVWLTDLAKIDGKYYIFFLSDFTMEGGYVITADSICGPWSKPRPTGMRPDSVLAEDEEGKLYLFSGPGCHVTELSKDTLKPLGETKKVYNGWDFPEEWAVEMYPCTEGPKVLRRNGWWYLITAQGGTFGPSTSHMVIAARSRSPHGPWENSPDNPIIHTYDREEPWWSKGHGQLVEGPDGQWYCILHGYKNGFRSLGRCSLIEPVEWTEDGWFKVCKPWPLGWEEPVKVDLPMSDDFTGSELGLQWQFYQRYDPSWFSAGNGRLTLKAAGDHAGLARILALQPMHTAYEAEVEVEAGEDTIAGLMLFSNPGWYIGMEISREGIVRRVQEAHRRYPWMKDPFVGKKRAALRIVSDRQDARFYYKNDAGDWVIIQPSMDVSRDYPNHYPVRPALFAYGKGAAQFRNFRYRPLRIQEKT